LGLLAAKAMATAGARHLILVGRHGVSTQAQEDIIAAIKSLGTEVTVALGNVADPDDLARVLRHADEHLPPLRGIVHTAGVLEDGALPGQTLARFQKVLGPKMIGTWNLHVQTLPYQIDFFILYSSLAALLGSPGLGNYVAANSFLDTFAHYRHSRNLAATSINWGLFTDTGMALKGRTAQRIIEHGIAGMTHATKEALFIRVLRERWTQMGIAELDFRIWRERHPQVATLRRFELLQQSLASPTKQRDLSLLATLEKAKASERIQLLENFVRDQLAAILRLDAERIGRHAPLRHLGIDSLMSLELRNRLESALGLKLSATLVWSYPHVAAIAEYLATLLPASVEPIENEVIAASTSTPVREAEASTHEDELLRAFDESMKRARTRRKS
jgi:NAD(P)-dependent dehydrogenase (short-subunit alcohol dehydrogenase family)/acyl carrier protein